jgi:hypothetical protein
VKPIVLTLAFLAGTAFAQGWTLEGRARFYTGDEAEVYAKLLGEDEAEIRVGTVDAQGEFRLNLPETLSVTPVAPNSDCGMTATPGLKLGILERLEVRRGEELLGELSLASQPISSGAVGLGERKDNGRYGFLFHANASGSIRQRCITAREAQFADVEFQPGWNWITARVTTQNDKPALFLSSGVKTGLMRWWFVATQPE